MQALLATLIFPRLFLTAPALLPDAAREQAFGELFAARVAPGGGGALDYALPYPKHEFLRYAVAHHEVLLHGTNRDDLVELAPRQQTDYSGRPTTAVFASGDGIWPLFFAVIDRARWRGSLRNACFVVGRPGDKERRFYFFSVNAAMHALGCWAPGHIYILPRATFARTDGGAVRFDEWASPAPVRPLARLAVQPEDFPFLQQVAAHDDGEKLWLSWLLYRGRISRARRPAHRGGGCAGGSVDHG